MKAGGRLAILDDYGRGEDLLSRFRIERIPAPTRPMQALRNNPNLAIAEPVTEQVAGKEWGPHPVVSNVKQLVTNHPTGMTHPQLSPVLQIRAAGNDQDVVVAVAGQVEKGRLFAMSDPSAVINLMLRYPGNRGVSSAGSCATWSRTGKTEDRVDSSSWQTTSTKKEASVDKRRLAAT